MKVIGTLVMSSLLLATASSTLLARPQVKTDVVSEVKLIDEAIAGINDYESRGWAIGLTGDTLKPDHFLKFFQDRDLELAMFVRSYSGVSIGDSTAYQADIKVLQDHKNKIVTEEVAELDKVIQDMTEYQRRAWAVGINGDTGEPDQFLLYFSEHSLPIQIFYSQGFVAIGSDRAYDENMLTLQNYRNELMSLKTPANLPR